MQNLTLLTDIESSDHFLSRLMSQALRLRTSLTLKKLFSVSFPRRRLYLPLTVLLQCSGYNRHVLRQYSWTQLRDLGAGLCPVTPPPPIHFDDCFRPAVGQYKWYLWLQLKSCQSLSWSRLMVKFLPVADMCT